MTSLYCDIHDVRLSRMNDGVAVINPKKLAHHLGYYCPICNEVYKEYYGKETPTVREGDYDFRESFAKDRSIGKSPLTFSKLSAKAR
jgi:hypothetical protein